MNLVKVKLSDLKLDPRNARKHDDRNIDEIVRSLEANPQYRPFVVQKSTMQILVGNGMYIAMQKMGITEAWAEIRDIDDEQAIQLALSDNRTAELADWDYKQLKDLFQDLGPDADVPGWSEEEIRDIFDIFVDDNEELKEDTPPAPEEDVVSREGDIWLLGDHRVMCGDSTNPAHIAKLMYGELADLLITDPPYNVDYQRNKNGTIKNDSFGEENAFQVFLENAFSCANTFLKPGGAWYVWFANINQHIFLEAIKNTTDWSLFQTLIWVKNHISLSWSDYQWQHEPCLYGAKNGAAHWFIPDRAQSSILETEQQPEFDKMKKEELIDLLKQIYDIPSTVIREGRVMNCAEHPTMKPLNLIGRQIRNSSKPNWLVLDIFGGSGSTLIASEQLHRKCYTMELDPKYADVIVRRWQITTGQDAYLESTGERFSSIVPHAPES